MDNKLKAVLDKIDSLYEVVECDDFSYDEAQKRMDEVVLASIEVYKDEDIKFFVPYKDNELVLYKEKDRNYICIYSDFEQFDKTGCTQFLMAPLKNACTYVYENMNNYSLLQNPEYAHNQGYNYYSILEYVNENPKVEGVILNDHSNRKFAYELDVLNAVMFKGMGVDTFKQYTDKGELIYEI